MIVEIFVDRVSEDAPNWRARGRARTVTRLVVADWRLSGHLREHAFIKCFGQVMVSSARTRWHTPIRRDLRHLSSK